IRKEIDGVPFIGPVDIAELKAALDQDGILLQWNLLNPAVDSLTVFTTTTNNFAMGGIDEYQKLKTVSAKEEKFWFKPDSDSLFIKILVSTPHQYLNTWFVKKRLSEQ
ncbi:MAG TPA: hypothetical protein PKH83_03160, partial [Cyclobacteriaceae bacterium]|nr:hypothetical protein [Cyclobacteriaceae bacterium]